MIFNGALGFFVIQDRFSMKTIVFLLANFVFQRKYWFFGYRHFVRRCCGRFFIEFIGLFKSKMSFQRELCVFATFHCVFKGVFNFFGGPLIDFQWCARFFVNQDRFSMKTIVFLVANFVFQ